MKEGDFVYVDYTGSIKESKSVFDTTKEEVAKKSGIYSSQVKYRPIPLIIGANFTFKHLEEEIKKMQVGDNKTVEIAMNNAFGQRRADLVKLIPLAEFKNSDIDPAVGNNITVNGMNGKIISVSGGRVNVDFNHPLAGKDLVYEIEVKNTINDHNEKVRAIVSYFTGSEEASTEVTVKEKHVKIVTDKDKEVHPGIKKYIADTIRKWVENYEKIEFVDVY
ncbi:MAG TPA: FKBP-type peptidyl-prolyl cis-trans isomerase [archaeon]|nr:FKBP-type peptidyl-prolyl cis-trans isomerase [archaeon]